MKSIETKRCRSIYINEAWTKSRAECWTGRRGGMKKRTATRKPSVAGRVVRSGRPPHALAGEVEERILDAAAMVFLERGFEGASVDEIADVARAGKPTIYARFPGKEALFAAVMARTCAKSPAPSRALH